LHYAVWNNFDIQVTIMRILIENGSDVNAVDNDGKTPLHYAAEGSRNRVIPLLMKNKANYLCKVTLLIISLLG
jgi:ankyrin repeat protein